MISESNEFQLDMEERKAEIAEKLRRLQELLADLNLDAIMISRHENIAWATAGLAEVRIGILRETGAGSLLITKDGRAFYLTTNNEAARLAQEEFCQLDYQALVQPWYAHEVQASIRKIVGTGKVAGDAPLGTSEAVSLQSLRCELTAGEIARYRWLGRQTADAAANVLLCLRPGMSEAAIQAMLAERLILQGILPSVYLNAVDDRIRAFRHPVPRRGILERFGMVGFCARRWGLSVSITRFIHFGALTAALEDTFTAVAEVNARLMGATREGESSDGIFTVAQEAYASLGYAGEERMHHQGGATGYAEREWVARPEGVERVLSQQAFAWNPNLQGAKVEDTIVLHHGRIERLTGTPNLPVVTTNLNGTDYYSAGVLVV
jgi:Xaa-Pro dipeptidase